MKISELRDWATATYGAYSHKEGQVHAALGPLDEWLGHLARHGVMLEVGPTGGSPVAVPAKPLHAPDEPARATNSGAIGTEADSTGFFTDAPSSEASADEPDPTIPVLDIAGFVNPNEVEFPK